MRTVVESERYSDEISKLGDLRRLDEALAGFQFTVSWDPECGQETANPAIRGIVVGGYGVAPMVIYYSFTATQVILESIRLADPDEDDGD